MARQLPALCARIAKGSDGRLDHGRAQQHLQADLEDQWPLFYNPDATVVCDLVLTARDTGFAYLWLNFMHIFNTIGDLDQYHLGDIVRGIPYPSAFWSGERWDIAAYLGLRDAPASDDDAMSQASDSRSSESPPPQYDFESVPSTLT